MKSHTRKLTFTIPERMGFVNITRQVEAEVAASGVREGLCLVNAMHITASVFINDDEAGLLEDYRRWLELQVEAINHATEGIPRERIRYHVCWGSWPGPHTSGVPLKDIVDLVLRVRAGAYLIEGANARHEHEYAVWDGVKLPEGKILVPGVVTHSTDVVEHPELVAQRIRRFARRVGKENVIAGCDCGFGGRSHPQVAWAKLKSLVEGAALASR